jgi:hypothetical protein
MPAKAAKPSDTLVLSSQAKPRDLLVLSSRAKPRDPLFFLSPDAPYHNPTPQSRANQCPTKHSPVLISIHTSTERRKVPSAPLLTPRRQLGSYALGSVNFIDAKISVSSEVEIPAVIACIAKSYSHRGATRLMAPVAGVPHDPRFQLQRPLVLGNLLPIFSGNMSRDNHELRFLVVNLGFHIPLQYKLEPRLKALKIATQVVHSTHVNSPYRQYPRAK